MTVPPGCFYPKPKVDSAIIELVPLQKRNWNDEGQALFRQVLRASFSQRRKTLFNCLKGFIFQKNLDPKLFMNESIKEGIDLKRRAETLTVDEFYKLTAVLNELIQ
jgi:16S rRNA (adenine1518-N6/adenine1519-N6)-dimethyltransferase